MSTHDVIVRDTITKFGIAILLAKIFILFLLWKWTRFRLNHFRQHLVGFESQCSRLLASDKKKLFQHLTKIVSCDKILRADGKIRILEIGVKTGDNIQYYPDGSHFIGVDWNVKLAEYLKNPGLKWRFSHVVLERVITGDGTCLKHIPDGSVDAVVTTRSLCAAKSVSQTLREIHRVLARTGKYLFIEHVPEEHGTFVRGIQVLLTVTKIWPIFFGGCQLNKNPTEAIGAAGFKKVQWKYAVLEGRVTQPHYLVLSRRHVIGFALR